MKNNKIIKKIGVVLAMLIGSAIVFGVGVYIGSSGQRTIIEQELEKEEDTNYTIENVLGGWVSYNLDEDGSVKLGYLTFKEYSNNENDVDSWSFTGLDLENESQYVDFYKLKKENEIPTYTLTDFGFDKKSNVYTYTYDIYGDEPDRKFYFATTVGKDFRTEVHYSKNPDGTLNSSRLYKLRKLKDGYYIDIDEIKDLSKDTVFGSVNNHYRNVSK